MGLLPLFGRYEIVPTPLTRLTWWRVVLDEAQMVESSTAKATEMALQLATVHRYVCTRHGALWVPGDNKFHTVKAHCGNVQGRSSLG